MLSTRQKIGHYMFAIPMMVIGGAIFYWIIKEEGIIPAVCTVAILSYYFIAFHFISSPK